MYSMFMRIAHTYALQCEPMPSIKFTDGALGVNQKYTLLMLEGIKKVQRFQISLCMINGALYYEIITIEFY